MQYLPVGALIYEQPALKEAIEAFRRLSPRVKDAPVGSIASTLRTQTRLHRSLPPEAVAEFERRNPFFVLYLDEHGNRRRVVYRKNTVPDYESFCNAMAKTQEPDLRVPDEMLPTMSTPETLSRIAQGKSPGSKFWAQRKASSG